MSAPAMVWAGRHVLITGATGFLGGALARRLLAEGASIRVTARTPEKAAALQMLGAQVIQADLTDDSTLSDAAAGCSTVFHVAVSYGSYDEQRRVNVEGTRAIAQAAAHIQVERFVHVSSISVYGVSRRGTITEDHPLMASAQPYGGTKIEGERIVREIGSAAGMPYTIIRPGMIYGPNADLWTNGVFSLARRQPTVWLDDGGGSAHMIHVDDVVDLMLTAAQHPNAVGQAFNGSPDPAPTWREVFGHYARLSGHDWRAFAFKPLTMAAAALIALVSPPISFGRDLPELADMMCSTVTFSGQKARERLGWSPRVALADGIAACADSLRARGLLA
ncbi:MAG: SDR family NAD(P)-dependent oxidoreductase [bacterium]|nr:SDR family NAD(P)-dependent oxidoreductase [bacterium]